MNHDLIARYIYAVTRHLPEKMRGDVEKEIDSLIADMLDRRCGDALPDDGDIRAVLLELGDPEEMALKYSGDENKSLISGTYYLMYKRTLRLVLPIAAAGIAFASILSLFLSWEPASNPFALFGLVVGRIIGGVLSGLVQAFAIITIVFAALDRKKVNFKEGDMFACLPPIPKKNAQIKAHEPIINMMWSIFAAVFFLGFPQIAGAWVEGTGWIPVFDTAVIRGFWPPIILWSVLGIFKEAIKLIEGQYTKRLAVATLVANLFILAGTAVVFLNSSIINPDFLKYIDDILAGQGIVVVNRWFNDFGILFFSIVCFILIVETAVTAAKAWKNGRG